MATRPTVFITGGASGIGAECGRKFLANNYNVFLADVNTRLGDALVAELKSERVSFAKCDVTSSSDLRNAVQACVQAYGRVDVAINCAGITGGRLERLMDLPEAEFDKVHNIDAKGIFLSMKEELRVMTAQEPLAFGEYHPPRTSRGVIVNVSSRAGLEGVATFSAYCSAKHAVIGLTKACSLEHAEDMIRINAICPGLITTPGHTSDPTHSELDAKLSASLPMKRWGHPGECVDGIFFLASPASSFMTGAVLEVDGGVAAKSR